jgi:hypothetical protein
LKFRDFLRFLRDLKILIFTLGSARRTIICLVLLFKEPGSEILPTLFDLMTSVGLYSGSISDIKLRTVFVVSTSPTGSGIPDMRIRLILPYCSRLSRSFVSCRLTFSRTLIFSMRGWVFKSIICCMSLSMDSLTASAFFLYHLQIF